MLKQPQRENKAGADYQRRRLNPDISGFGARSNSGKPGEAFYRTFFYNVVKERPITVRAVSYVLSKVQRSERGRAEILPPVRLTADHRAARS